MVDVGSSSGILCVGTSYTCTHTNVLIVSSNPFSAVNSMQPVYILCACAYLYMSLNRINCVTNVITTPTVIRINHFCFAFICLLYEFVYRPRRSSVVFSVNRIKQYNSIIVIIIIIINAIT